MGGSFEKRLAQERAEERRVRRELQAQKELAERQAADLRQRKSEAARAARPMIPDVRRAGEAVRLARGVNAEKLMRPHWWSGDERHVGWILRGKGRRFEIPFRGPMKVDGLSLEKFVEQGLVTEHHFYTDSDRSDSWTIYVNIVDVFHDFLTKAARLVAQQGR